MPIASCGGRRAGPRPALGEVPPTRTGRDKGAATLGELRMRTACLVVFASLFLVAVVGSALAQKECDDELGDTVLPTSRPLPGEHAARGAVSSGRHLESHQRRSPR